MGGGGIPGTSPSCPVHSRPTHILLGVQSVVSTIADYWVMACSRNILSATPLHCVLLLSSCQCWSSLHGCSWICSRYVEVKIIV